MKKKILFGYNFLREGFVSLEDNYDLKYPDKEFFQKQEILDLIEDFDVLVPNFSFLTDKDIIDKGKKLKLIANFGVGYNNIDVNYASKKGIVVTNTPNSVLEPTAELCFGLMSATARRIGFYNNKLRTAEGLNWGIYANPGIDMYGKTLGIFGMGRIGQAVARRAVAGGMRIIYHNRKRLDNETEAKYDAQHVSFDELLERSDFLTLNAPATPDTFHLIGEQELKKMKSTAILINTARGSLVDEQALIVALKENIIWGAGLDVYEKEPHISSALLSLNNVVLTPHAGTQTIEGRLNVQREVIQNILGFFEGEAISTVN